MKLSEEQIKLIEQKLKISNSCPNCGFSGTQSMQDSIYHIQSLNIVDANIIFGRETSYMPSCAILCPKCGYTRLFNLKILGVIND